MAARTHTFLFADLVGFTALTAAEGDDRAASVAVAFNRKAGEIAGRHGAERVKAIGDAVMLRCDRPPEGIKLGLDLVAAIEADPGLPPVRVGVHSGPAVAHDGDWYGQAVNVASRLCSAAGGGEVLISEQTLEAAGRLKRVELSDRRLHWLKNITDPVAARSAALAEGGGLRGLLPCSRVHSEQAVRFA